MAQVNALNGKTGSIFAELENRFANGFYKFGEIISPSELATEFSVSQQPMRAVMYQLSSLGFVVITPQVGCRVASPTISEIKDFFQLFGRAEGVMAALAAERHSLQQLEIIEKIHKDICSCKVSGEKGIPDGYSQLIGSWHQQIREMTQSPALILRLNSYWSMSNFLLYQGAPNLSKDVIEQANNQRFQIYKAIAARQSRLAEQLMYEHVISKPIRVGIIPTDLIPTIDNLS